MIDRNNVDDIYNIINDDFNWIIEDRFDDGEEFKQKYKDIEKLVEKIENIRQEYSSICKDDVDKKEEKPT